MTAWMACGGHYDKEINQPQKDKPCMTPLTCGIWNNPTHGSREEKGGCRGLGEGGWGYSSTVQSCSYAGWVWRARVQPGDYR